MSENLLQRLSVVTGDINTIEIRQCPGPPQCRQNVPIFLWYRANTRFKPLDGLRAGYLVDDPTMEEVNHFSGQTVRILAHEDKS